MDIEKSRQPQKQSADSSSSVRGFLMGLAQGILRDMVFIVVVFVVVTGASALVCLYYELPLALSAIGGILALGIALAFKSNSIFD